MQQKQYEAADIETASEGYASRFEGSAGKWMLQVQERIISGMISQIKPGNILDVGGGHGQLALPLSRQGYSVTVSGSDLSCSNRIKESLSREKVNFIVNEQDKQPFADKSFDLVVSIRLLPHWPQWQSLVSELCRVCARCVIVDYPTSESLNRFAGGMFKAKKKLEGNTRPFRLFNHASIDKAFMDSGFSIRIRKAEFFIPMVLHRTLRCAPFSSAIERAFSLSGLTNLWGSPVIVMATREA